MTAPQAATLVLAGSGAGSASAQTPLLGLPLVRRTALAASRAGFDRVYVLGEEAGPSSRVLTGTGARCFPRDAAESALPPGRIVLLPDRVVASPQWLRSLREAPAEPECLHRVGAGAIVQTAEPVPLARALARQSSLSAVMSEWSTALPAGAPADSVAPPVEVTTDAELAAAETLLLKGVVKKEDGIVTRYVSRKISLAVTRRLARTRVTPNVMTVVCVALGLAAAWSFASPALPRQIAGGLVFLLHSILDGCDGEMARLKFQESRLGGILDFWGDNLVHVAVFSAFALAWSSAIGESWPLVLGAVAVSGTVLSAGFVYNYAMRPRAGGGSLLATASPRRRSQMTRVLDAVSGRDFIYLVMVLSLFGKAYWFLAAACVGTPAFFLAVIVAALGSRGLPGAAPPLSPVGQSSSQTAR